MSCPRCADPVGARDRYCEDCGASLADQRVEVDVGLAAGISDQGLRHARNEDAVALRRLSGGPAAAPGSGAVAVVCDGVSSAARPDEASRIAAEVAADALAAALDAGKPPVVATREAIHAAARAVAGLANPANPAVAAIGGAPACTVVSAAVTSSVITVGWVGDSRAYWIPRTRTASAPPIKLTEDDSWLAQVVAAGILTPAQAAIDRRAHAITAWLGSDAGCIDPHVASFEPDGPGIVVACTDGLWNYLDTPDAVAAALPAQAGDVPLETARRLVEIALDCGGRDNVTVAVLPCPCTPLAGE